MRPGQNELRIGQVSPTLKTSSSKGGWRPTDRLWRSPPPWRGLIEVEPGLRAIYRLESADPNDHRIKLLEVNEQTVPTGIVPVGFPAHPASGLHYPSVVIEVTPQEYEAIQRKQLNLPTGWEVRDAYERPAGPGHAGGAP